MCKAYPSIRFHIVHLSAAEAVPRIRTAREQGINNLTVETCYHYLTLSSENIPANATQFKCCPPIRSEANRKQICQALLDGVIDYVVSDHSPCIPELKKGDFMSAWGGVSGLGLGLSLLWTEFGEKVSLAKIMSWVSTTQAKQVGIEGRKGSIAVGMDADFVLFDPDATYTVDTVSLEVSLKRQRGHADFPATPALQEQALAICRQDPQGDCREYISAWQAGLGRPASHSVHRQHHLVACISQHFSHTASPLHMHVCLSSSATESTYSHVL